MSHHIKPGPVPKPLRPKDYLHGKGNVYQGGRIWWKERVEQLLKHPDKNADVLRALGMAILRYMQYDADCRGLDGDKVYPD